MILDYSNYVENTMVIKLPDGEIIKARKPTQKIFIDFVIYQEYVKEEHKPEELLEKVTEILGVILNNNVSGKTYGADYIGNIPFEIKTDIFNNYSKFMSETVSNPN